MAEEDDISSVLRVEAIDPLLDASILAAIDAKTKPLGALGRMEALALQIARIQRTLKPRADRASVLVFAADHGIAAERVSAYPQQVTRQMVLNFAAGGAAISVFARTLGLDIAIIDAGVAGAALEAPGVLDRHIGPGTANCVQGSAMSAEQRDRALRAGVELGRAASGEAVVCGEMGIANTSAAALLMHKIEALPLDELIGRGTGLDDVGLAHKRSVLTRAAARTGTRLTPLNALCEYGGFEIAMMAGAMIGAAQGRKLVLVDGFIATAAACAAIRVAPAVQDYCVFAHRAAERGHDFVLAALGARPLFDLDMRLGEGTGAALAWPLVRAAAAMLTDMASFASASVTGKS